MELKRERVLCAESTNLLVYSVAFWVSAIIGLVTNNGHALLKKMTLR